MRELLVYGEKTFKIKIPDDARVTFGPWSPPTGKERTYDQTGRSLVGTLRIYENAKASSSILAVFSGVRGYRDLSLDYDEETAREEGAIIWKSDKRGYYREEKVTRDSDWIDPIKKLPPPENENEE